jgi:hypothetical protein
MYKDSITKKKTHYFVYLLGKLAEKILIQQFGSSKVFIKSATQVMEGSDHSTNAISSSNFIEEAIQVSNCGYEYGTCWGQKVYFFNICKI